MRIPNIQESQTSNKEFREVSVNLDRCPDIDYGVKDDEKSRVKFIKRVEKIARKSNEYKDYIKFLKTEVDMNQCSFFSNVDRKDLSGISIEIHHAPFTLFDLTEIIVNKFIQEHRKLSPFLIAEELMKIHYKGLVGLIPLSVTTHQLVHAGELMIPLDSVYGNLDAFLDEYNVYLTDFHRDGIKSLIDLTLTGRGSKNSILDSVITKIDNPTYTTVDRIQIDGKELA